VGTPPMPDEKIEAAVKLIFEQWPDKRTCTP
jgi:hypothetical protein